MKRVDFIGAPGVGKSTLLRSLITHNRSPGRWITQKEALYKALNKSENVKKTHKLLLFASKVFRLKQTQMLHFVAERGNKKEFNNEVLNKAFFLVEAKVENRFSDERYSPSSRFNSILSYYDKMRKLFLYDKTTSKSIVLCDESFSHHTRATDIIELVKQQGNAFCLVPDGVVHCTAPIEIVMERLKKRQNKNGAIERYANMKNKELRNETKRTINYIEEKATDIASLGVPVKTIDVSQSIDSSRKEAGMFINRI